MIGPNSGRYRPVAGTLDSDTKIAYPPLCRKKIEPFPEGWRTVGAPLCKDITKSATTFFFSIIRQKER